MIHVYLVYPVMYPGCPLTAPNCCELCKTSMRVPGTCGVPSVLRYLIAGYWDAGICMIACRAPAFHTILYSTLRTRCWSDYMVIYVAYACIKERYSTSTLPACARPVMRPGSQSTRHSESSVIQGQLGAAAVAALWIGFGIVMSNSDLESA